MLIYRIPYFFYYLRKLNWNDLNKYMNDVQYQTGRSKGNIWYDLIKSSIKYNISILEYFQFRFFEIGLQEKKAYAGTGYMYEYQLEMNPKQNRNILENKIKFLEVYKPFIRHEHMSFEEISEKAKSFLASNKKVVLKDSNGQCGIGIKIIQGPIDVEKLLVELKKTGNDMVESYIVQHTELMKLSPSGLNTVRIITQLDNSDNIHFLGGRLRITVNSGVDTGIVSGPAVYSDITKEDQYFHPVTGIEILGFKIPFWKEILAMTKSAALFNTANRSIGWDVAVTDEGPELLEGNHDWCKLLWQLPVKRGLKLELEKFISE